MAPKRGSDDIGWQHGIMLENRHNFKCNYCGFVGQGGGVSRLKKHLAGGRLAGYHDVQGCKSVPKEVKKAMSEHIKQVRTETARKKADKEIAERIISGRQRDEDDDDEVQMYAEYVPDPDVQERLARAHSRAEAWEADQRAGHRMSFQGAQHEVGSGSGSGSAMKRFREATGTFAEPSAIAGRERVDGEDPMVAWVARATTERGEYELDEEADDPEDPSRPNTFLARAVAEATAEEEGDRGNVGQPYSPRYEMDPEAEVDLLADIQVEHVTRTAGRGGGNDDDDDFDRLMEGLPRTQSRRRGLSTQDAPPSQSTRAPTSSQLAKGKQIATESRRKKTGATESRPSKGVVIREPPPVPAQKKKGWFSGWGSKKGKKGATVVEDPLDIVDAETLDPNADDETPSPLDSPRLPNSASHDSMTTGGSSDAGGDGGGNGGGGNDGQGGGGGEGGEGGGGEGGEGGGGGMAFTEEQFYGGATQDSSHGAPLRYNRRQRFPPGSEGRGEPVDSHSYDTMLSDFERMSTHESAGSYGGHSYQPDSTSTDYSSGYGPYSGYTATTGYLGPSPYMHPPPAYSIPIPVQVFVPEEDVQMAQLGVVRPGCQVWDHYLSQFRQRYHSMMTWDEFRGFVSRTKGHHLIGELPSESDESESMPSQSQWNAYDPYQQGH
ncbi:hypothetical protein Taro_017849 [Colocasia esculenta]|uniref:BED-type domain-containing protein n=1 Tax=Colocasia esculenta TaxID=4460 RepID=A0A843UH84_COLES|nr:hypothetical protein [Colocasia esculenta]